MSGRQAQRRAATTAQVIEMPTKQLAVPTIHPNGTSKQSLSDELKAAFRSLNEALKALVAAAPNGRDYYTQGGDAFNVAAAQHRERVAKVESVRDEIMSIAAEVAKQ